MNLFCLSLSTSHTSNLYFAILYHELILLVLPLNTQHFKLLTHIFHHAVTATITTLSAFVYYCNLVFFHYLPHLLLFHCTASLRLFHCTAPLTIIALCVAINQQTPAKAITGLTAIHSHKQPATHNP